MRPYRFYLCGADGHFLNVQVIEYEDAEVKLHGLRLDSPEHVVAVEAWGQGQADRSRRAALTA
jgi:hypothetical protein